MKVCKAALAGAGAGGFDQVGQNFMLGFSPLSLHFGPHPSQCKCRAGGRLLRAHCVSRIDFQWDTLLSPLTMGAVFAKTDLSVDPAFIGFMPDRSSASRGVLAGYLTATQMFVIHSNLFSNHFIMWV